MEEYTITNDPAPLERMPMKFVESVWYGKGGIIRIEEGALPSKILWELKQLLRSIAVGFQWHNVNKLKAKGMHSEHAEHHITKMLSKLTGLDMPPIPSDDEMAAIRAEAGKDGEDGSDDQVPEQDIP